MGGLMLLLPGEYGEKPPGGLVVHEACGIRWDADDVIRFLGKCSWESREVLETDLISGDTTLVIKRCLMWQGAKSRGGAHRAAGRKVGNKQWYGSFSVKGKTVRAHKFSAVVLHGLRPGPGDEIDHGCYNTLCVFCLECVPKIVNQGRIRRGNGNAPRKLPAGVLREGRHNSHPGCTGHPVNAPTDSVATE